MSGTQPCSGNSGAFTKNASANSSTIQCCEPSGIERRSSSASEKDSSPPSGVASTPSAMAAASISSDPASV